jgi:membrane protease YdiL (CAAX protease family)
MGDIKSFLFLVLIYPNIEELAFRGAIQGIFLANIQPARGWHGITIPNLLTSFLFVVMHFVHHPPLWALAVFVPSLIFGYFKDRFESIIPSIFLHSFYNTVFYSYTGN